jgi:tRNA/rRNA methyltransferase
MHIPTREEHVSMNLGQAVAVCLYELARADSTRRDTKSKANKTKTPKKTKEELFANAGQLERITTMLLDALRESGYMKAERAAAKEEKIRRMVRRLELSGDDATLLQGMLRQIVWKLKLGRE